MLLAVGNDGQFARFSAIAGHPEWAQDPRFATGANRVQHREVLVRCIQEVTRTRSTADWIAALEHHAGAVWPHQHGGPGFC